MRSRRRSRSRSVRAERAEPLPSGEVDLTLYMTPKKINGLSEKQKATLRSVLATQAVQRHFKDFSAASGAHVQNLALMRHQEQIRNQHARAKLWKELHDYANPIPSAKFFFDGMEHYNSNPDDDRLCRWNVERAIASTKVHYLPKIKYKMQTTSDMPFKKLYPFVDPVDPAAGVTPLSKEMWEQMKWKFRMNGKEDYVKHLLNAHEGEARFVGESDSWEEFPASGGGRHWNAIYWSYQFVRTMEVRKYLYERSLDEWRNTLGLSDYDINWIMALENNETTVLKRVYNRASGGWWRWYIRRGHYVTLSEVFNLGCHLVSCYDLYCTYRSLQIWIHKRVHSVSNTPEAQMRRNAQLLRHQEEGVYSLRR